MSSPVISVETFLHSKGPIVAGIQNYGFDYESRRRLLAREGVDLIHSWCLSALDVSIPDLVTWTNGYNERHAAEFMRVRRLFDDEFSQVAFDAHMLFRLLGTVPLESSKSDCQYFDVEDAVRWNDIEHFVDLGAFDGDSSTRFMREWSLRNPDPARMPPRITAVEPDPDSYTRLIANLRAQVKELELQFHIRSLQAAINDRSAVVVLQSTGTPGTRTRSFAGWDARPRHCDWAPDNLEPLSFLTSLTLTGPELEIMSEKVTYVKMDMEGCEVDALTSHALSLSRASANLAVSVYHNERDLLTVANSLACTGGWSKFFLRLYGPDSTDLVLYACK
jgi:FkbM family methyltransferase